MKTLLAAIFCFFTFYVVFTLFVGFLFLVVWNGVLHPWLGAPRINFFMAWAMSWVAGLLFNKVTK